jgi:hypothetical protein
MSSPYQRYLVEQPEREREAVRIFMENGIADEVLVPLGGLHSGFAWFILQVRKDRLRSSAIGDIDILAGRLDWAEPGEFERLYAEEEQLCAQRDRQSTEKLGRTVRCHPTNVELFTALKLAMKGDVKWPPATDQLVAIEAKCAYLSPKAKSISREYLKSTKTSKRKVGKVREQVRDLLESGFNRVALLDVIATPPASGLDGQVWLTAAAVADDSRRAMQKDLEKRLPQGSPAGHYVWSLGAVVGGDERMRGASSVMELGPARENPLLSNDPRVRARRCEVDENLGKLFASLTKPLKLRVVYLDCPECKRIHHLDDACSRSRAGHGDSSLCK